MASSAARPPDKAAPQMTVTTELKEIKEMLRKIIHDMTRIREAQKQTKEEVHEVRDELRRFRELWKREKAEIEERLQKLEEEEARRELQRRLERFERMDEALELREKRAEAAGEARLEEGRLRKHLENVARKQHGSSAVSIQCKKLRANEKNAILKDGQRLIKQLFGAGKTDL